MKYRVLNQFANDVPYQNMALLYAWRFVRWRTKAKVDFALEFPPGTTRESNRMYAQSSRGRHGLKHISRIPACRDTNYDVALLAQSFDLP